MADTHGAAIDRLLAGEVSAEEQRQLAQSALNDPDLFDQLTAAAAVQSALQTRDRAVVPNAVAPRTTSHRGLLPWMLAATALAAAAIILMAVMFVRPRPAQPPPAAVADRGAAPVAIAPILLTARAGPVAADTFRSAETTSRLPKRSGAITAVRDGVVEVDLGAIDGMSEGLRLPVARDGDVAAHEQLTLTTIFRERSRGRVDSGAAVRVGDRVDVSATVHMKALLEQAAARQAAQDNGALRQLLEGAATLAKAGDVPADLRRQARYQLASFKHRSGELVDAERLLTSAAADFESTPVASPVERADVLNELGTIQIDRHAYDAAERTLRSANSYAGGAAKMRTLNNLGATAALRGDRAAARSFYDAARAAAGDAAALAADRTSIDRNLSALGSGQ